MFPRLIRNMHRLGEYGRNFVFWHYDRVRGGKVWNHIQDINHIFHSPNLVKKHQDERLKELLRFVTVNVPYYREYRGVDNIVDLPVISKNEIKGNYDRFLAKGVNINRLTAAKTSGSQGVPFVVYHDKRKNLQKQAALLFFNEYAGYRVGQKHVLIRTKKKNPITSFLQNQKLILASHRTRDKLEHYRRILKNKSIGCVIGHPSLMVAIGQYVQALNDITDMYGFNNFIATSEPLYHDDRQFISNIFGCQVIARYSSEEFGILAHELPGDMRYHLNNPSVYIELLSLKDDMPVKNGAPGRVVVTDLYSYAMPLIRYDTGDVAVLSADTSEITGGRVFERIEGRQVDIIYNTNGEKIFPLYLYDLITSRLSGIKTVVGFQFIQKDRDIYALRIANIDNDHVNKHAIDKVHHPLKKVLGQNAHLAIEFTQESDILFSGKRPFIINEYSKKKVV
jgi:phenylacetate-CoA ligase